MHNFSRLFVAPDPEDPFAVGREHERAVGAVDGVFELLAALQILDPDGSDAEIYNRYAHISISLADQDEESRFVLDSADLITIHLNISDLAKLEVGYVLSKRELSVLSNEDVSFIPIQNANGFTIYQLKYAQK